MSEKTLNVHFSSETDQWSTPQDFYDKLDKVFHFTLDPCADDNNAKAPSYYTKADDGLSRSWDGERVFMNPPYGREIGEWVEKASKTVGLVVCLVPARTDTRWWQQFVIGGGCGGLFRTGSAKVRLEPKLGTIPKCCTGLLEGWFV